MELITTHICMTRDLGNHGNLFGGIMMAWLDEAGAIFAAEVCDSSRVTTVMVDKLEFVLPVRVGNLIKVYGEVEKLGNTSITIVIEARRHCVADDEQEIVCHTRMVYVNLDMDGKPTRVGDDIRKKFA